MYVYYHNVESILEHRFFNNIFLPLHFPQNEPTCKALGQFLFFMYSKFCIFRARQAKIIKCMTGVQTRTDLAEI